MTCPDTNASLQDTLQQCNKEMLDLKAEIDSIEGEETAVKEALVDLKHELSKHNTDLKNCQNNIKYYMAEVCDNNIRKS